MAACPRFSIQFVRLLIARIWRAGALADPDSLVSLVMSLRRGSTLVDFAGGLLFFGELNGRQNIPAVIAVLIGIVLTVLG